MPILYLFFAILLNQLYCLTFGFEANTECSISTLEINLPRKTQTTLSQLRSGYSMFLNSYLARIKPAEHTDHCPDCGQAGHTTQHLFQCPSKPTELEPRTLWEDPPAAATFLGLPTFQDPGELDDND